MNHAGALCNAADMAGFAAAGKCNSCRLFYGIRGHDGVVCRLRCCSRSLQLRSDFVHMCFDGLDIQSLTDDAGGADKNLVLVHTGSLSSRCCHALGVFHAFRCTRIGVAGVGNNCLCQTVFQMLHADIDRRSLYAVAGKGRCRCRNGIADDERQIVFICRTVCLDAAVHACCAEAFCGANAAFNLFHDDSSLYINRGGYIRIKW